MTCIAGIVKDGVVWIGGDSCGSNTRLNTIRRDGKVFETGEFIIGYTSSYRMGQLLQYSFHVPKQRLEESDYQYMTTRFIDSVRDCFKAGGYMRVNNSEESGGKFLVGYRGNLYEVDSDYQVGIPDCGYSAVGSGDEVALGSLYSSDGEGRSPRERIILALEAAEYLTPYVKAPFHVMCSGEEEEEEREVG